MDHEIDNEKPSGKEGGEMKVGDKVWVLCEVAMVYNRSLYMDIRHDSAVFEAKRSDCRPVEPASCPKILDSSSDPVNPSHYKQGGIECIEAIKAALCEGFPDYLRGNVMKYLWRYKEKGGVEDLRKSAWYLDRLFKEAGE
jgi:hypothetical protein